MAISIKKYVDIVSGVGAGTKVSARELILRMFTSNPKVSPETVVEVTSAADVASMFGTQSEEYMRASRYFGYTSKVMTQPRKLSIAYYDSSLVTPYIRGGVPDKDVDAWMTVTDGSLTLSLGSVKPDMTSLNFSAVKSLSEVANLLQGKLRALGGKLASATVTYDSLAQAFNASFVGWTTPVTVEVGAGSSGTDVSYMLGWQSSLGMTASLASTSTSELDYVIAADNVSDNYGSFCFCGGGPSLDMVEAIAKWTALQNVKYMYSVGVTQDNIVAYNTRLSGCAGTALTLVADPNTDYDEMIPCMHLAATDYSKPNASTNYMYVQVPGITPKMADNAQAVSIDANTYVNYYGRTRTAGTSLDFYQNGYLCGGASSPAQMTTYANEMWLKSTISANLLEAQLVLNGISADNEGVGTVLSIVQNAIDLALSNGVISVGKGLTRSQQLYIYQVTGNDTASYAVQNSGYWVDASISTNTNAVGAVTYVVEYTLIYSKSDQVNKITGRNILI